MNPEFGASSMDKIEKPDGPDGWVSVQNGEIHVADPGPDGQPAVISAGESVLVYVNETAIHTPTEVWARTPISIQLPFRAYPEYQCQFEVSEDRCTVWLKVIEQSPGCFYRIPDSPAVRQLLIEAESVPAPLNRFADDIGRDILSELKQRKIKHGLQLEQIQAALESPGEAFVIAQGQPPISPQNKLEDLFAIPEPDRTRPQGFQLNYPSLRLCKAGELLVQRHLSTESKAGISVFGETLRPQEATHHPLLRVDTSVRIDLEQNQAVASLEGIPSFNGRDVRVRPLDKRLHDLEGGPGAIYDIKGSLQVNGSVEAQARIWVTQHLEISGDVSHAHMEAHEHILIHGNIIRSQLMAGGDAAACMRLLEPVQHLHKEMGHIHALFREIRTQVPRERQPEERQLFIRIIKTQFPHLREEVESLWNLNHALKQLHPRRTMLLKVVLSNLMNLNERLNDERRFLDWLDKLGTFIQDLQGMTPLSSHIYANYVQGSELFSQGSIFILGEGCYNSRLQAGKDIVFCGLPGYCREGQLKLGGHLIVPELGSPNGSRLQVHLSPSSFIRVQKLYPGVELYFGKEMAPKHILEAAEDLEIRRYKNEVCFFPLP